MLGELGEKSDSILDSCSPEEKLLLKYVWATMPLSDFGDYDLELFPGFVKNALQTRREFPWCAALPENIFLLDVLYPRINTEELADCREEFYRALADRVRSLSLIDAVLEVNRWCAEEASYRSTDDCTASALSVYRCGYGRCGEESTFAVNALRSVGIAARQVYAPWWSHCDDNHAWVEVYDGEAWRYLGACEPEPELDRGWFTSAASRAVMIHTRAFAQGEREDVSFLFPDADPMDLRVRQGVVYETVTARYGETRPVTVSVRDGGGNPVPGGSISVSLLNMARFSEIAALTADESGTAQIRLGLGCVKLSAFSDGCYGERLVNIAETGNVVLTLKRENPCDGEAIWQDFDFTAPAGASGYPTPLSPDGQRLRREWLDSAAALREAKMARLEAREHPPLSQKEARVWNTLTEKDRAWKDQADVLRDSLDAFRFEGEYPPEVFDEALLCPRIALEPLFPWRRELSAGVSEQEREAFRRDPRKVWDWVERNIRTADSYPALSGTPAGIFRLKAAGSSGRAVLFCALCRSFGIPARLSPLDGVPEYYRDGSFLPVAERGKAAVLLRAPDRQGALSLQSFTLSRLESGTFRDLRAGDIPAGESVELSLAPGRYLALTVSRMPNGNQLARRLDFSLAQGETREISLSFREGKASDMLECQSLPPFSLWTEDKTETRGESVMALAPHSLLLFLEVGREPTEHILNELREAAPAFRDSGCALHFILESPEQRSDPTLRSALAPLPDPHIWYSDFRESVPVLARRMFADPDKLPLVILADRKGNGLYSCSGYNVGTGELLLRLLAELSES